MPSLPARNIPVRPTTGIDKFDPGIEVPITSSPDMQNFQVYQGYLRKRPGFVQYGTGSSIGGIVTGLYSTHDDEDNQRLYALYKAGVTRFNPSTLAWDAMTGPALTGSDTELFSFETSQNCVVFSQGVDSVMSLPLTGTTYAALSANCPPAKYLTRFADRLYLANTVESGVSKPYRVRWSVSSDHTDWTGVGSGFRDNTEQPYFMKQLMKLQNDMAVYTERSILYAQRTGASVAPARFTIAAPSVGVYAPFTLASRNQYHMFLGNDDFYMFNGGMPTPFGTAVRDFIFQSLNPTVLNQMFGIILSDTQEYLCFIATGNSTTPDTVWVYNYGRDVWYPWTTSGSTCATLHRVDNTTTIDSLVGTIDQQTWQYNSAVIQQAYPALLTGNSDGKIYKWSSQYPSDNGSAIDAYWCSKDWISKDVADGFPQNMVRLNKVGVGYLDPGKSFTLDFYWSFDGGATWSGPESVTMGGVTSNALGFATWFHQLTDKKIRVKIRNNSASESPQIMELFFDLAVDSQTF